MATSEPKITRLAPGEGAGSFKRKSGPDNKPGGGNTRNRTPKGQRRTQNPAILSDGSVDPKSKQYQRSVAGREKLEDFVKRLDAQGADERDIFMAAVNSLKNRGHGYVGAYLDSKNPSRRYNDVQAKAIADSVMSKANVGENPGARLTKPDKDTKEAQADKRAASKESGSTPEPGRKAMPIRQQRREVVGQRKDKKGRIRDVRGRGERALGMPETWAKGDTGVDLTTKEARDRERAGWKGFDPAVSGISRPELSKKSKQQQAQRGQKKEKGSKEDQGPETAAQRFQKSLKQEPQPTQAQGKQLDELLAKREEMEPEEFEQAFKQLMEAVKTGEGGQREALRQYIDGIKGKGVRAPLPGSSAAADRDKSIEKEQAAGREQQELRQKQAQAGREEAKKRRQAEKEAEADRRVEEEIPTDTGVPAPERQKYDPVEWQAGVKDAFKEQVREQIQSGLPVDPDEMVELTADILREDEKYKDLTDGQAGQIAKSWFNNKSIDGFRMVFKKDYKPAEGQREPEQEAQGPKTTTEQPAPAEQEQQPAEKAREQLPEERLGRGKARAKSSASGFTPEAKTKAKTAIKQAVQEGKTAQQLVEEYNQGNLFGKTGFNTNPDTPPIPTESPEELAPSSSLPDESRPVAESPGQKTFLRKGSETSKKPQILPSSIQVPKPAQGVTDAQSYTKQLQKANIPSALINKAVKDTYGSRSAKRRRGTTSSSEYQQFSDAVRQVVKIRSAQLVKSH
jgi:hypothetical protein